MSPLRCPVCKAVNERGPQCRRCRADLALLFELETQRRRVLDEAGRARAADDWPGLLALGRRAHGLRQDSESARLMALGSLLQHDFAAAWEAYSQQKKQPEASF